MADKDAIKLTKERIAALKELRKLEGELTAQQAKTLDGLRDTLKELRGFGKHQQNIINKGGVYSDLSKQWAMNAASEGKTRQNLAGLQSNQMGMFQKALSGELKSQEVQQQRVDLQQMLNTEINKLKGIQPQLHALLSDQVNS